MKSRLLSCIMLATITLGVVSLLEAGPKVKLGIDVLEADKFAMLKGKRVGLLTHKAGVNGKGVPTVDVLHQSAHVNLVALFGPEHGIYGNEGAEKYVDHKTDPYTGLPVYSLYGPTRKPTEAMLDGIDTLVIDLQDVGVRCYTYISCMLYAMEACFEQGVHVVVLDRPNPLGGLKADGPVMESRWQSYVGAFRIPHVHGLTIGELAFLGMDQLGWLSDKGVLTVVPMQNWNRGMAWDDTGLKWVETSPHIRTYFSALGYPLTGLGCQMGGFKHGLGSRYAFRMLSYPGKTPQELEDALAKRRIPGLKFKVMAYEDYKRQQQEGVLIEFKSWDRVHLAELNFHLMQLAAEWSKHNPFSHPAFNQVMLFNKHVGSDEWWQAISSQGANVDVGHYVAKWKQQSEGFRAWAKQYMIYE